MIDKDLHLAKLTQQQMMQLKSINLGWGEALVGEALVQKPKNVSLGGQ